MGIRVNGAASTTRAARRMVDALGDDLREARLRAGLSQKALAGRIGQSQTVVSRLERGAMLKVPLTVVIGQAAALGCDLNLKLYPRGSALRDAGQLALIGRLRARVRGFSAESEVPIELPGDLRAWDLVLTGAGVRIGVEAVTRLRDLQALLRAVRGKQRDSGYERVLIVLAATHANRRAVVDAEGGLDGIQLGTRQVMAALSSGRDPGRDAIILL